MTILGLLLFFPLLFRHFEISDGLPNNTVTCCLQDRDGKIWIGSKDGICSFDGYGFKLLEDGDPDGITSGMTLAMCIDPEGDLWFIGANGTGYYDMKNAQCHSVSPVKADYNTDIEADAHNGVWISNGNVLQRSDIVTDSTVTYRIAVNSICIDTDGEACIGTADGRILKYDSEIGSFDTTYCFRDAGIKSGLRRIETISDGLILIGADDGQLMRANLKTGQTESFARLEGKTITCMLVTTPSRYLIGTLESGIYVYDESNGFFIEAHHASSDAHSLSHDYVTCMIKDRDDNLWVGTFYHGLNLNHKRFKWFRQYYASSASNPIDGSFVHSICKDDDGYIWAGTEDGGLNRIDSEGNVEHFSAYYENCNFHSLLAEGDHIWAATYGSGIYVIDRFTGKPVRHYNIANNQCTCILKLSNGQICTGTAQGVFLFNGNSFELTREIAGSSFVQAIMEDSKKNIWTATYGSGLWFHGRKDGITRHYTIADGIGLKSDYLTSFLEDSRGRIWIPSEGGGLHLAVAGAESGSYSFINYTRNDGMPSNICSSAFEDNVGDIWVATTNGLVRLDPETMRIKDLLLQKDRITGAHFVYNAIMKDSDGFVYLGTNSGMVGFIPEMAGSKKDIPLTINYLSNGKQSYAPGKIRIPKRDASALTISFTAVDFSETHPIEFDYSLRNKSVLLSGKTQENSVTFSDLKPGRYTFTVRTDGSSAQISEAALKFRIVPPFYRSIWGIFTDLMVIFGIYLEYSRIRKRVSKAEKEKEGYRAMIHGAESNDIDKEFMDRLQQFVMNNISDQKLDMDRLQELMGTSKSTLYRKIKANTGLNTNEYIRLMRLKKAADLMTQRRYRINEISFMVGFSSPSYFTTSFQKQFGISPTQFRKNIEADAGKEKEKTK